MIKLGLIGAGRIAEVHARAVNQIADATLIAVNDINEVAAKKLVQAQAPQAMVCTAEEIFANQDIDALIIAAATDSHCDLIEKAAVHAKPVFCEKPYHADIARIVQTQKIVSDHNIPLMIGFNRRFDPQFSLLREKIKQGEIGKLKLVSIHSKDPAPPSLEYLRSSGGLFRDMMIHDFDMIRFLLDEEIGTIYAQGSAMFDQKLTEFGDIDCAMVQVQSESGVLGQIACSRHCSFGYDQRIEVHGEKGTLFVDNHYENQLRVGDAQGLHRSTVQHFFLERYEQAYYLQIKYFIESVRTKQVKLSPSGTDGLYAQQLAQAACDSWDERKALEVSVG